MDERQFYSLFASMCFVLVGLWWTVLDRRADWRRDPARRGRAAAVMAAFLLPGAMGMGAQIAPEPVWWRSIFAVISVVGAAASWRLFRSERGYAARPVSRWQWGLVVGYLLVAVVSVVPGVGSLVRLSDVQVAAFVLVAVVLLGHALAWEFLSAPDEVEPLPAASRGAAGR